MVLTKKEFFKREIDVKNAALRPGLISLLALFIAIAGIHETIAQDSEIQTAHNSLLNENYREAVIEYTMAIEKFDEYAPSWYGRGMAYYYLDEYDKSLKDFNRAIELKPDYFEAYFGRGMVNYYKGIYESALTDFEKAVELNPESPEAFYARANTLHMMDKESEAYAHYTKAIKLDPDFGMAYYGRAVNNKARGRQNEALADFKTYLDIRGNKDNLEREVIRLIEEIEEDLNK
ncbi:MAG: tetratricopeptide repeat protein [Bacteroidota bacterium]